MRASVRIHERVASVTWLTSTVAPPEESPRPLWRLPHPGCLAPHRQCFVALIARGIKLPASQHLVGECRGGQRVNARQADNDVDP